MPCCDEFPVCVCVCVCAQSTKDNIISLRRQVWYHVRTCNESVPWVNVDRNNFNLLDSAS